MIRIVLAEWRKLRRPTLFLGTIGAALFFTGLTSTFLYLMIDSEQGNSDRGRQKKKKKKKRFFPFLVLIMLASSARAIISDL